MNEIAAEAGISKALLFFYFKNKKEFYLFLWHQVEDITKQRLMNSNIYEGNDIFKIMYNALIAKINMYFEYPDMGNFSIRAYYERDPEIKDELLKIIEPYTQLKTSVTVPYIDPLKIKEGIDLNMMYRDMYLASEGYMYEMLQKSDGELDIERVRDDYKKMIDFWEKIYLREAE
jgi:AcrR family transcriptional regulator